MIAFRFRQVLLYIHIYIYIYIYYPTYEQLVGSKESLSLDILTAHILSLNGEMVQTRKEGLFNSAYL